MKVMVRGIGDLTDYFGKTPRPVDLPEGARVRDLLQVVEQIWGADLPPYLWDFEKHQFHGPVVLVMNKKALQDLDALVQDGSEIHIMRAVSGG